jgi:hypothetical protein
MLVVAGPLLHFVGSASAFWNSALSPPSQARSPPVHANEFDIWWEERRARNRKQEPTPSPTLEALQLDRDSVALVLTEFVRSDYARQTCNNCNVMDVMDYGQIDGMFESVRLVNTKIEVKLKRTFGERNEALLDRLAMYLRARIPQPRLQIHAMHRDGEDIY